MLKIITKPIGCLFSLISTLVVLALILVVVTFLAFSYILSSVTEGVIENRTDFAAHIAENDSSLLSARLDFKAFTISNPSNYPTSDFIVIRELVADIDAQESSAEHIVMEEVVVDVGRFSWVENAQGVANAVQFVEAFQASSSDEPAQTKEPTPSDQPAVAVSYVIKKLTVRIGQVSVQREGKSSRQYDVNYEKTFTDVTDIKTVANAVSSDLAGLGLSVFRDVLMDFVLDKRHLENVGNATKTVTDKVGEVGGKALEESKKAVEGVGEKLKNLF